MLSGNSWVSAVTFVAAFFVAMPVTGAEIEVTAKQERICKKAEARYKDLYPQAKDDAVVVVKLYKYTFCPPNVTVKVGTTVRWVNVDKRTSHSVWLKEAGEPESDRFFPEEMWEFPFQSPGEYPYLCGPHWEQEKMRGLFDPAHQVDLDIGFIAYQVVPFEHADAVLGTETAVHAHDQVMDLAIEILPFIEKFLTSHGDRLAQVEVNVAVPGVPKGADADAR